jgi:hypothetical protein
MAVLVAQFAWLRGAEKPVRQRRPGGLPIFHLDSSRDKIAALFFFLKGATQAFRTFFTPFLVINSRAAEISTHPGNRGAAKKLKGGLQINRHPGAYARWADSGKTLLAWHL